MGRRRGGTLLALGGFTLLALAVFRPTPSELTHTAPAFGGRSDDAILLMSAMRHVSRALWHDPWHLFDAPISHPLRLTLANSDHMIGQALVGLPIWLATGNPLLQYNLLALGSYVLGATATFVCARSLGIGAAGAAAAGVVFAFTPYRFHSPLWLQVLCTPFMPLALWAWFRFVARPAWSTWLRWIACWTLHGLMGMYLLLYFSVVMGVLVLYALVAAPTRTDRRLRAGLLGAPLATGALLAPSLLPYVLLRGPQGNVRSGGLDTSLGFLLPGPGTISGWLAGLEGVGQFGPGLPVWILAIAGIAVSASRREAGPLPARFVCTALVIGLATTTLLVFVPLRVQQALPGFDMVRATNRAFFVSLLFLGLFVGWAVDWIGTRRRRGRALAAALVVLLAIDVGTPPRERKRLPTAAELSPAHRWLAELPADAVVYERVIGPEPIALAMYAQIFHGKRLPIGYGGFANAATRYLNNRLFRFPAPESLRLLRAIDAQHVLQHFPGEAQARAAMTSPPPGVEPRARFGSDVIFHVDDAGTPPAPTPATPLPRTAWQVTTTLAAETLPALRDGDAATVWGAPVPFGTPAALTIDLGAVYTIAAVRCVPATPDELGAFTARTALSTDGVQWHPVGGGFEPDSLQVLFTDPRRFRFWELRFPPARARFVRLTNPEAAFWSAPWRIAELDVLEERAP